MSPELAEICGIHAGDGYFRIRQIWKTEIDISGHLEEQGYYDNHVVPLFNKVFNLKLKGRFFSRGTYGFVIHNIKIGKLFNSLGFPSGKKSKIVKVPELILKSKNKTLYAKFLRGLLDTDGHIGFRNRRTIKNHSFFKRNYNYYPIIQITTISEVLSDNVCFMLNELGIKHFVYSYQPKNIRDSYKYVIVMSGVERLSKWMNLIGSKNPVKLSRYLVWKKHGHCPTNLTLQQRENILNGKLDINNMDL